MTTLIDAMLETARVIGAVREGTATGGSTTTLIDTQLNEASGYYKGGTIWLLSGDNDGTCDIVAGFGENTVTLTSTLAQTVAAGVCYAIANNEYPKHRIMQAVLTQLRFAKILKTNDTLAVTADTEEYSLPSGVSNVRRVEVAASTSAPYGYAPNRFWKEWNGKIIFDKGYAPTSTGNKIRLWYEGIHEEVGETEEILTSVDINWLKWSAAAFLYREEIKRIQKDNPTALDLLNEAKSLEAEAKMNAGRFQLSSMPIDSKLAGW